MSELAVGCVADRDDAALLNCLNKGAEDAGFEKCRPVPAPLETSRLGSIDDDKCSGARACGSPTASSTLEDTRTRAHADDQILANLCQSSEVGEEQQKSAAADDECLTNLMADAEVWPSQMRGAKQKSAAADDERLTNLMAGVQVQQVDAALLQTLSLQGVKADKLLRRIAELQQQAQEQEPCLALSVDDVLVPKPGLNFHAQTPCIRTVRLHRGDLSKGSLCYYASIEDVTTVKYLCDQAAHCGDRLLVCSVDGSGQSALHYAAFKGNARLADVLLQAGADVLQRDKDNRTPLHLSAFRGSLDVSRLMIGTCIYRLRSRIWREFQSMRGNSRCGEDVEERAAFHALSDYFHGLEDLRRELLLVKDCYGFNCVHYALRDSFHGCLAVLKFLLSSCCEILDRTEKDSVMQDIRFQAQAGPTLVQRLGSCILSRGRVDMLKRDHIKCSLATREEIVNGRDSQGLALLHYAAAHGNHRAVPLLFASGADVRARAAAPSHESDDVSALHEQLTPLDLARDPVTRQAMAGYLSGHKLALEVQAERILCLVKSNCENINCESGLMTRTPLHAVLFQAIKADADDPCDAKLASLLNEYPECDPLSTDANGWTPVHYACAYGCHGGLNLLLAQFQRQSKQLGAEKGSIKHPKQRSHVGKAGDQQHNTQATRTIPQTGRLQLIKKQGEPVKGRSTRRARSASFGYHDHVRTRTDSTALSAAAASPHDPSSIPLGALMGRTPTHVASQGAGDDEASFILGSNGQIRCLQLLDQVGLLELEAEDDKGMTPLLCACAAGAVVSARWLLERRADSYKVDHTSRNALHVAAANGHGQIIRLLCYYDSDTSHLKQGKDWKGRQPVDLSRSGKTYMAPGHCCLLDDFATLWEAARNGDISQLQYALSRRDSVDALSPSGWTAAMYAAAGGHIAILRHLISLRCLCDPPDAQLGVVHPPKVRSSRGRGPLHLAAETDQAEICALLVSGGASLGARTLDHHQPLMSACIAGKLRAVQALIHLKADVEAVVDPLKPSHNIFHLLAAGNTRHHADCIQWIAKAVSQANPCMVVELLERHNENEGLLSPVATAKFRGHTYSALVHALKDARKSCSLHPSV